MGTYRLVYRVEVAALEEGVQVSVEEHQLALLSLEVQRAVSLTLPSVIVPVLSEQWTSMLPNAPAQRGKVGDDEDDEKREPLRGLLDHGGHEDRGKRVRLPLAHQRSERG